MRSLPLGKPPLENLQSPIYGLTRNAKLRCNFRHGIALEPLLQDLAVQVRKPPKHSCNLVQEDCRIGWPRLAARGPQPVLIALTLFCPHVAACRPVEASLFSRLDHSDPDQQLPQFSPAVDLEFPARGTQEEGTERRLNHVLRLHTAGKLAAQVLFCQAAQAISVVREQFARRIAVAAAKACHESSD